MRWSRWTPLGWLLVAAASSAQTVPAELRLVDVATGLNGAVGVRHAGDGSGRRFVIRRQGRIEIIDAAGNVAATPFLDVIANPPPLGFAAIGNPEGGDERGLLGLAFHPLFETNGRAFVYYINGASDTVVAEYGLLAGNPGRLDPASARVILRIWQPATNHNGGDIHFGPDGYLYIGMGDGGGSNDVHCGAGQALTPAQLVSGSGGNCTISGGDSFLATPPVGVPAGNTDSRALLGKMLRIDVDISSPRDPVAAGSDLCGADPGTGIAPYDIPPDNPFAGDAGANAAACDETYHYGLRNPFRWSFDRANGDLVIGDVGQSRWEEVDLVDGSGGRNFGWNACEGFHVRGSTTTLCSLAGRTDPILAYGRTVGFSTTGGFRYRGPHTSLQGLLFFGDYGDQIFAAQQQVGGNWIHRSLSEDATLDIDAGSVVGFGEDEIGHLYVTTLTGEIRRFSVPARIVVAKSATLTTDAAQPGVADAGDVIGYAVSVTNSGDEAIDALVVTDRFEGGAPLALVCTPTQLAPGGVSTCAPYSHAVTQDDLEAGGSLDNSASASAMDTSGDAVQDSADASIAVAAAAPQLRVDKVAQLTTDGGAVGIADAGDVIAYTVTVTNAGNVRLAGLALSDQLGGAAAQALSCAPSQLQPGQQATCDPYQHLVTQADVDAGVALANVASASATRVGGGSPVGASDAASIAIVAAAPALLLSKAALLDDGDGDGLADPGETIGYSFEVQNTGNVTLSAVVVDDPLLGAAVACVPSTLAPGAAADCGPRDHVVQRADVATATLVNVAIARAIAPSNAAVESASDSTSTPTDGSSYVFADGFEG